MEMALASMEGAVSMRPVTVQQCSPESTASMNSVSSLTDKRECLHVCICVLSTQFELHVLCGQQVVCLPICPLS